jgi:hypothetical protein
MRPPLKVLIVADGDDARRLVKRVGCAARALDVDVSIEEKHSGGDAPHVFVNGSLFIEGLQRTEAIQENLAQCLTGLRKKELNPDSGAGRA